MGKLDEPHAVGFVGQITAEGFHLRAGFLAQGLRCRIEYIAIAGGHDHARALAREGARRRKPDTAARPGDQDNLVLQPHFHNTPPVDGGLSRP